MTIKPQTKCPVCGSAQVAILSIVDGKTNDPLLSLECQCCGIGRIDPLPDASSLRDWYTEQYRQAYKGVASPRMRHVVRAARLALKRWSCLAQSVHLSATDKTLDVGASSGEFVYLLRHMGLNAFGLEPHAGYGGHAREVLELPVMQGILEDAKDEFAEGAMSLVSMFHVFEHVVDPLGTLQQIRSLLKPGGYFAVEVPDAAKLSAPHTTFFKAHTLYFSKCSMTQLLEGSGFHVLESVDLEGNLLFLAQRSDEDRRLGFEAKSWSGGGALRRAQEDRQWLRYLIRETFHLSLLRRAYKQIEERLFASRYSSHRQLLNAVYRDCEKRSDNRSL